LHKDELFFPEHIPSDARTLITKLLTKDPTDRIGNNDLKEVFDHPFFEGMNF